LEKRQNKKIMAKGFDKFINKEPKGAAKKEMFRVEKRKAKADARALGEEMRRKKKEKALGIVREEPKPERTFDPKKGNKKFDSPKDFTPRKFDKNKPSEPVKRTVAPKRFDKDGNEVRARIEAPAKPRFEKKDAPANDAEQPKQLDLKVKTKAENEQMPLNKFVAHAGICGRREAAEMIKKGLVAVNGDIIFEPGFKVWGNEDVKVKGKKIFAQRNLVYLLVNKPKDYITTAKDPEGRKTILDLVKGATPERIYPVGRLDRNTTGVLIMTNDGELAQKLTHPSYEIKKIYEVKLDKPVTKKDLEAIAEGVTLEDGFIQADTVAYIDQTDKSIIGIEIHSGRNRIVRRIFEHLGYDVKGLDRVMFANLTKKNVDRGKYRMLSEKEVRLLKFMNQSFLKKGTAKNASTSNKFKETED
jgi:23S rRNA pseudouridine2605 synthase